MTQYICNIHFAKFCNIAVHSFCKSVNAKFLYHQLFLQFKHSTNFIHNTTQKY